MLIKGAFALESFPKIQQLKSNSVIISWFQASPNGILQYNKLGKSDQLIRVIGQRVHATRASRVYHLEATLNNLSPNSSYFYQINTRGPRLNFKTLPKEEHTFKFAVISDTQWHPQIHRHITNHLRDTRNLKLVLVAGDLAQAGAFRHDQNALCPFHLGWF